MHCCLRPARRARDTRAARDWPRCLVAASAVGRKLYSFRGSFIIIISIVVVIWSRRQSVTRFVFCLRGRDRAESKRQVLEEECPPRRMHGVAFPREVPGGRALHHCRGRLLEPSAACRFVAGTPMCADLPFPSERRVSKASLVTTLRRGEINSQ